MLVSDTLQDLVTKLKAEEPKINAGNASAAVRGRKLLMEMKKAASVGRDEIQKTITEAKGK